MIPWSLGKNCGSPVRRPSSMLPGIMSWSVSGCQLSAWKWRNERQQMSSAFRKACVEP